ncbi:MAG: hypothetical protein KGL39_00675 [Patescibacteria group bacterium]|nr:hypothetical protein [Patescibacteria group bacterium]
MKEVIKPRKLYEEPEEVVRYLSIFGELQDYLDAHPPDPNKKFQPHVYYNREGDLLEFWWDEAIYYVKPVGDNSSLELHCEMGTDRVVGCKIWGVKGLLGLWEVRG